MMCFNFSGEISAGVDLKQIARLRLEAGSWPNSFPAGQCNFRCAKLSLGRLLEGAPGKPGTSSGVCNVCSRLLCETLASFPAMSKQGSSSCIYFVLSWANKQHV